MGYCWIGFLNLNFKPTGPHFIYVIAVSAKLGLVEGLLITTTHRLPGGGLDGCVPVHKADRTPVEEAPVILPPSILVIFFTVTVNLNITDFQNAV